MSRITEAEALEDLTTPGGQAALRNFLRTVQYTDVAVAVEFLNRYAYGPAPEHLAGLCWALTDHLMKERSCVDVRGYYLITTLCHATRLGARWPEARDGGHVSKHEGPTRRRKAFAADLMACCEALLTVWGTR